MKKVLSAILAASMVLSLAACGQQKSTESKASGESKAEGQSQTGAEGAVWKIGGIGPVTGGAAVYGLSCKNAQQLAVDEINAAGGINGYKVEIEFDDDEHDAECDRHTDFYTGKIGTEFTDRFADIFGDYGGKKRNGGRQKAHRFSCRPFSRKTRHRRGK